MTPHLIAYLATYGAAFLLERPREPSMVGRYQFKTNLQVAVLILSLLLPPIVEDLAFRHFILSVLPFNASVRMARAIAAIETPAWRQAATASALKSSLCLRR